MKQKILIVEDDRDLQDYLREFLLENDFSVETVSEGAKALKKVEEAFPDLVVLDLGLPDISGETVCRELKKFFPELPIIILTAKDTSEDVVRGLNLGADDYIAKPFEEKILLARIKARLRNGQDSAKVLIIDDLELDNQTVQVQRAGKNIKLTQREFLLLEYLMRNKNRVLSREMILDRVWSYTADIESRVVDVYVGYLRKKVDEPFDKKLIHCIRGFGYTIKD
ncbi:MAG: response regulator transcription factor [bacterium]|nr:response regulator transcription factor [bacterium]